MPQFVGMAVAGELIAGGVSLGAAFAVASVINTILINVVLGSVAFTDEHGNEWKAVSNAA